MLVDDAQAVRAVALAARATKVRARLCGTAETQWRCRNKVNQNFVNIHQWFIEHFHVPNILPSSG